MKKLISTKLVLLSVVTLLLHSGCSSGDQTDSEAARASRESAESHLTNKRFDEARKIYEGMVSEGTANAEVYAKLAELDLSAGNQDKGEQLLKDALTKFPDNPYLLHRLGSYIAARMRYAEAVPILIKARDLSPNDPAILMTLSMAQLRNGNQAESAATAAKLYELVPGKDEGIHYATRLQSAGETEQAERIYRKVLAKEPDDSTALNNLASLLGETAKLTEAETLARKAAEKAPDNGRVLDTLGWILYKQKKNKEAADVFKRAVKLAPAAAIVHYHYGVVLDSTGNASEYKGSLTEALRLAPDAEWASDARSRLDRR